MARKWHKNFDWTSGETREFFNFYNKRGQKLSLGFPNDDNDSNKVYFEKDDEVEYISMNKALQLLDAGMKKQVEMYLVSTGGFSGVLSNFSGRSLSYRSPKKASTGRGDGYCINCARGVSYNVDKPLCRSCYRSFDDPYEEYFDHCHKCGEAKRRGRLSIDGYTLCSACWKIEN